MHGTFTRPQGRLAEGRFSDWRLAAKSIVGFWFVYALTVVARALLAADPTTILTNRLVIIAVGSVLTGLIYIAIATFAAGRSIRRKAIVAFIAAIFASTVLSGTLMALEDKMKESKEQYRYQAREGFVIVQEGHTVRVERHAQEPLVLTLPKVRELDANKRVRYVADTAVIWLFFFGAWAAFYLATVAQAEALNQRRRAAEAEGAAQAAQVRALRYQVNPHFLFNTLNSLSSLVMSKRPEEAEEMIIKLSTFFRTSLSLDPTADVTLAQEIEMQRLYLDIETVRFPRRLNVEMSIPKELEDARVPGLILQPLVENAIKYGVAGSRDKVRLSIVAQEAGPGRFTIEVTNNVANEQTKRRRGKPEGTGVGLANVCQRLEARFGAAATCEFGPTDDAGYRVLMTLPLDHANG